jgi:hypothetical protein
LVAVNRLLSKSILRLFESRADDPGTFFIS